MARPDVVILLIGLHGSGKSTFTRAVTGAEARIGSSSHGVTETTTTCKQYTTVYREKQFTIIDTPGLADKNTHEENLNLLCQIADQLQQMGHAHVSGVIYFHSIQSVRLTAVHMANLRILKAICGDNFPHVAFVTSRWDRVKMKQYGPNYETINHDLELERRKLLPKGPRIFKFLNDDTSHQRILDYFANKVDTTGPAPPQLLFAVELKRYQYEKTPGKAVRKTGAGRQMEDERKKKHEIGFLEAFWRFIGLYPSTKQSWLD